MIDNDHSNDTEGNQCQPQPLPPPSPFACDIYSYGILAHAVLSGKQPYARELRAQKRSVHQVMRSVVAGLRPDIPNSNSDERESGTDGKVDPWPEGAAQLVRGCWSGNARERPSFSEVVQRLDELEAAFHDVNIKGP